MGYTTNFRKMDQRIRLLDKRAVAIEQLENWRYIRICRLIISKAKKGSYCIEDSNGSKIYCSLIKLKLILKQRYNFKMV